MLAFIGQSSHLVLRVADHLSAARRSLLTAQAEVQGGRVAAASSQLDDARRHVVVATDMLHGPELALAGVIPGLHQNLHAVERSVELVLKMTSAAGQMLRTAQPLVGPDGRLEVPIRGGQVPLATAKALANETEQLAFDLPGPAERPAHTLVLGRIAKLQDEVYRTAAARRQQFSTVGRALDLLVELAGSSGPRRYLIAAANTAEMRGTGGMILSYGVLSSNAGKFTLDRFGPIDDLKLATAVKAPGPADYLTRFAPLGPSLLWRNVNLAADFTVVAPIMEQMFTQATGQSVDGVIQIDPAGLAGVLRAIGPVSVPQLGDVTADNVVSLTLNQAYTAFPDRPVRQEFLGAVAEEVFRRLVSGDFGSVRLLARSLADAATSRHLVFYSSRPDAQRAAALFDATGQLPPEDTDYAELTVQNLSANKLDYYLDSSLKLTGTRPAGRLGHLRAEINLTNTAPVGGRPPYVFGPNAPGFAAGDYHALVELYLPTGAFPKGVGGDATSPAPFAAGEDQRSLVAFGIVVPAGQSRHVTIDIVVPPRPPGRDPWVLVPAPRVRPTAMTIDIDTGGSHARYTGLVTRPVLVKTGG